MTSPNLVIPVDAEHGGIRTVGCFSLIGIIITSVIITNWISPSYIALGALIGIIAGAGATSLLDKFLQGRWASGRELHVTPNTIALVNKGKEEVALQPEKLVNPLFWHFEVTRNTRVKKGWYVVGFALEQNDDYIATYTFLPPSDFENLPLFKSFTRLQKKETDDMRQAGIQRRLLLAEKYRNEEGAEMTPAQFTQYIQHLQANFSKWMPQS